MSELKPLEKRIKNLTIGLLGMADGETIQVNKSFLEHVRADMVELSKLRRAQPANEPLTIEQLRQMDGEPVWCADGDGHSCYCLVNAESGDCIDSECGAWCFEFYGMTGDGENGLHNMGWLAYDHKQGGEPE